MNRPAKKPADAQRLDAFLVEEFEAQGEKRSSWSKIGSAWPHTDGQGFRLVLKAVPTDGVVILRAADAKQD